MSKESQYHTLSIPNTVQLIYMVKTSTYTQIHLLYAGEREPFVRVAVKPNMISKRQLLVEMVAIHRIIQTSLFLKKYGYMNPIC
mmetsp:Transcript_25436/g.39939  ORF Transcript_25436/g.39939 Transcript_25436/m.39939 type:complete len:84 (+) Transcript_25436:282-533(+)